MSGTPESTTFNYVISMLPQLITIIAAIAAGFKALSYQNEKKTREVKDEILKTIENEKLSLQKDMQSINKGIDNLDRQYKVITEYIKDQVEKHDRVLERLKETAFSSRSGWVDDR